MAGNNTSQTNTSSNSLSFKAGFTEPPKVDLEANTQSSSTHISISDEDLLPTLPQEIAVAAWHSTLGFCESIPADLENLCREIEATGVSGAIHKEVSMGRYVY